jgi:siroheme synthase-like protein
VTFPIRCDKIERLVRFAYPVMLDVTDRLVVIIGGGAVAARKARALIDAGATRIRVVAPKICEQMPAAVERIIETYEPRHLDGGGLVYAATDQPAVNEQVVRDAHARGILANRADDGDPPGDFITPAVWRQGGITLAISAGSAALAVAVRDELVSALDDRHVRMSSVMGELRTNIRTSGLDARRRADVFRDLAGDEALDTLAKDGERGLLKWLAIRHPELKL